jgi:hypothetical protein
MKFIEYKRRNTSLYTREEKTNLKSIDIRMCIWVFFQRCKIVPKMHQIYLNMEDENNSLDEYLTLKKSNLKSKKYSFNY